MGFPMFNTHTKAKAATLPLWVTCVTSCLSETSELSFRYGHLLTIPSLFTYLFQMEKKLIVVYLGVGELQCNFLLYVSNLLINIFITSLIFYLRRWKLTSLFFLNIHCIITAYCCCRAQYLFLLSETLFSFTNNPPHPNPLYPSCHCPMNPTISDFTYE